MQTPTEQNYPPESDKSPYSILRAFTSQNEKETFEFGKNFAAQLKAGDVIGLFGNLGSGKTTCIKGICSGLGVIEEVTSPTFTLINEYQGRLPVFHFDFYRISSPSELKDLGIEEYLFGDGICLIEWPEIIADILPDQRFEIHLAWNVKLPSENQREIILLQYYNNDRQLITNQLSKEGICSNKISENTNSYDKNC